MNFFHFTLVTFNITKLIQVLNNVRRMLVVFQTLTSNFTQFFF